MIKNKTKAGMILIYTDEYGNQKAIEPDELKIKIDDSTIMSVGQFMRTSKQVNELHEKKIENLTKIVSELSNSLELLHSQLVLDNVEIESLKKKIGGNK